MGKAFKSADPVVWEGGVAGREEEWVEASKIPGSLEHS